MLSMSESRKVTAIYRIFAQINPPPTAAAAITIRLLISSLNFFALAKAAEQERIIPSTMHKPYIGIIFPKRLTEGNISNSKRSDNITVSDRTYHQYFAVGINWDH